MPKQPRAYTATGHILLGTLSAEAFSLSKRVTPWNSIFSWQFSASVACRAYPLGFFTPCIFPPPPFLDTRLQSVHWGCPLEAVG